MAAELMPAGMRVPLAESDAAAPKMMQHLHDLLPGCSEQLILERALACLLSELALTRC
jgi:hypothetical protein